MSWYGTLWNDYKTYTPAGALLNKLMPSTSSVGPSPQEQQLLAYNEQLKQQQAQAYAQQQQLAMMEAQSASGNGPSLASAQLGAGLDQINRNAGSQTAGVGGEGGVLARYAAMNSAANAGASANQAGAIARVDEVGQNRQLLGQTLGGMQQNAAGLYGADLNAYTGLHSADVTEKKNQEDLKQGYVTGLTKGISSGGAAKATG